MINYVQYYVDQLMDRHYNDQHTAIYKKCSVFQSACNGIYCILRRCKLLLQILTQRNMHSHIDKPSFHPSLVNLHCPVIICSGLLAATLFGVILAFFSSLKGQNLISVVYSLVLFCARGKACAYHILCSHIGGVTCHVTQSHALLARVFTLVHRVREGTIGSACQAIHKTHFTTMQAEY